MSLNFRNATLFSFPRTLNLSQLETHMQETALKPVGALELSSTGFIPPLGRDTELLAIERALPGGNVILITVGVEERILPGSVVAKLLGEKLAEIEKKEGRMPGGRTRKRIKEDLIHELLPKAFVRPGRVDAILDLGTGILAVNTGSRKQAENVVSLIRHAIGSFPALPVNAMVSPRAVLTGWIAGEPLPAMVSIGDEAEMRDAMEGGAVAKLQNQDLMGEEIGKHLESGKQATKLGLIYGDRVSFVIGEDLVLRKIKLLDGALDQHEDALSNTESLADYLVASFIIFAGELRTVVGTIGTHLRLAPVEE